MAIGNTYFTGLQVSNIEKTLTRVKKYARIILMVRREDPERKEDTLNGDDNS